MFRMKDSFFEIDDLVAVFGGEVGQDGKFADKISICRVLVCGENDLIVEDISRSFSRINHHIVSKSICHKLFMDADELANSSPLNPLAGDLVLSYSQDTFKNDLPTTITGILYKTTYRMGKPSKAILICGDEMKEVFYNTLIVIQRNKNNS